LFWYTVDGWAVGPGIAVASDLRERGHQVFAPTLTGSSLTEIGDRLVDAIARAGLKDLVLVGHSDGGPVIQYTADRLANITQRVVFVDAWVLHDGEAIHDVLPDPLVEHNLTAAELSHAVAMEPAVWTGYYTNGATDEDDADRLVPMPIGWLTEPVTLPRFWNSTFLSGYVHLNDDRSGPLHLFREMARRLGNPRTVEAAGPHHAMLTHPRDLADALLEAADLVPAAARRRSVPETV
jgi:pimeloyl-ACP methyl ester carboxylesterase